MAKYAILSEKEFADDNKLDGKNGILYRVKLIPEGFDGSEEVQEYFVADGEDVAVVLSQAANNHQSGLEAQRDAQQNPVDEVAIAEKAVEVEALDQAEINSKLK